MIGRLLQSVRSIPPQALAGRAAMAIARRWHAARERRRDIADGSFAGDVPDGALNVVCDPVLIEQLEPHKPWIDRLAALCARHRFNLLGSGWVHQTYGMSCKGTEGTRYDCDPGPAIDRGGEWLKGRVNAANLAECRRLWRSIDPAYVPIDWQRDFKSGYRWNEGLSTGNIALGGLDGVDAKVPWELSRMQHMVVLAWSHRLAGTTEADGDLYAQEFRNQVLDFIATNPPRFGINWFCAMDVAIRAANWVVAYGLFRAHGAVFDTPFESAFKRSLVDHGRHIVLHLEYYPEGRGNHYLADISGLLFIAACLPRSKETDFWLALAAQELAEEIGYQFNPDGSTFEGSTSYHRLSLEIATYAAALLAHIPEDRQTEAGRDRTLEYCTRPRRPLTKPAARLTAEHITRLARAAAFAAHTARPDGLSVQIGDNDNGRFLKPHPVFREGSPDSHPAEEQRDCSGCVAAVHALLGPSACTMPVDPARLDGTLVRSLSGDRSLTGMEESDQAARVRVGTSEEFAAFSSTGGATTELTAPGSDLRAGLTLFGYPDFGLWIFRSDRLFLSVRCGSASGLGAGGSHAHNDQLSIDLMIDGEAWISDPGSYLYCLPLDQRNRWRSVTAHTAPQWPGREPGSLELGHFRLRDRAQARCLYFGEQGFAGEHMGFGNPVRRLITLTYTSIVITDYGLPPVNRSGPVKCVGRQACQEHFKNAVPFSPGYGEIETNRTTRDACSIDADSARNP